LVFSPRFGTLYLKNLANLVETMEISRTTAVSMIVTRCSTETAATTPGTEEALLPAAGGVQSYDGTDLKRANIFFQLL
jgi:hypothetical protein